MNFHETMFFREDTRSTPSGCTTERREARKASEPPSELQATELRPVDLRLNPGRRLDTTKTPNLGHAILLAPVALNLAKTPVVAVLANQKRIVRRQIAVPKVAAALAPSKLRAVREKFHHS